MENNVIRKDAYMIFGYTCNQRCLCCPCEKDQRVKGKIDINELKDEVDCMIAIGITDVTVSGGEPTVYPNFFEILKYLIDKNLNIHLLSNCEKFANIDFAKKFIDIAKNNSVTVTTTFHSCIEKEHEKQNNAKGSFKNSLKGLQFLEENNIQISIKQCITMYNYRELSDFIKFIVNNFSARTEIQLWGIDLCGINKKTADKYFVNIKDIKPYIEEALNYFEEINVNNRNQLLTINNLPLCMCDCYYWNYFTRPDRNYYIDYKNSKDDIVDQNFGLLFKECKICQFARYCKGTYLSVFDMYGDSIIEKPADENNILKYKTRYNMFNEKNIDKLFFSIYCTFYLTPNGLTITNKKSNYEINIRLKSMSIKELFNVFDKGIEKIEAIKMLEEFGIDNAEEVINDWMIRGIIE